METRISLRTAAVKFAGQHVVFTDIERDNLGKPISGIVAGVFENYQDLSKKCKEMKCEIEVGFFGSRSSNDYSPRHYGLRQNLLNFKAIITSSSLPIYLLRQRHDNISKSWSSFIHAPTEYPLICQSFYFLWLRDWFKNGGYSLTNIDESFLFQTAWLHRNTLHGVVKGDKKGIYDYAQSAITHFGQIANGSGYRPVKLRQHSGAHFEILDGHHRAAYLVLSGQTMIKANVVKSELHVDAKKFADLERKIKEKGHPYYDFRVGELSTKKSMKKDSLVRLKLILDHLSLAENLTMLDVGCHTGFFTILFNCYGIKSHGINPSKRELEIASEYAFLLGSTATFTNGTLRQFLVSTNEKFDVTLSLNMFYSLVREEGKIEAISQLRDLIKRTKNYMFFSTSMPNDKGAPQWQEFAMTHDEIVSVLSEYGVVTVIGQDKDYNRNIYKLVVK